jgi:hypothetical protein
MGTLLVDECHIACERMMPQSYSMAGFLCAITCSGRGPTASLPQMADTEIDAVRYAHPAGAG